MITLMNPELEVSVELTNQRVVAVDGGTATGKGRLIEELSQLLRLRGVPVIHISTGSLYRAVALASIEKMRPRVSKKSLTDAEINHQVLELVRELGPEELLRYATQRGVEMHGGEVWIDGSPASLDGQLKAPAVGTGASIVSIPVPVREFVNALTRRQVNEFDGFTLIDGRDITHTVVPDAPVKLLLTVAPHIAAERSREHTLAEITARDEADRKKSYGALKHADDPGKGVLVVETDKHTPESLRDLVYAIMRKTFPELPKL